MCVYVLILFMYVVYSDQHEFLLYERLLIYPLILFYFCRIREVAEKINKYGPQSPQTLQSLKTPVKQIVIGPSHLGLLLEDGRALRVAFTVITERLDLSKSEPSKGYVFIKLNKLMDSISFCYYFLFSHFCFFFCFDRSGTSNVTSATNNATTGAKQTSNTSRQLARSRARIMRASTSVRNGSGSGQASGTSSRGTGVIIGSSSSGRSLVTVPAPFVPEELVSQAQVVLQGKSRNVIIRELQVMELNIHRFTKIDPILIEYFSFVLLLQRTNLDVNLAVNNLLSRDDEEGDDTEEGSDNYAPEDLISLLDNSFHADNSVIIDADTMFSEEMFGYSSIRK